MQLRLAPTTKLECSAEEWQARVDLAAAHRLAYNHGFHEGIFNHLTLLVPGHTDRYYQIPFGMHWSEVKASNIMEVGFDGLVKRGSGDVERSAYAIHMPMHRAKPKQCAAVFHTHMPYTSALTRLEDPRIKEIGQTEVILMNKIAYDEHYDGPAFDPAEGDRLAGILGDKSILFMANHGVTTVGTNVAEAWDRLYYIERVAQVQIYAMWTGQRLKTMPANIVERTSSNNGQDRGTEAKFPKYDPPPYVRHFAALKRMLDRSEPDYAE